MDATKESIFARFIVIMAYVSNVNMHLEITKEDVYFAFIFKACCTAKLASNHCTFIASFD